jgi:hypothetical protein
LQVVLALAAIFRSSRVYLVPISPPPRTEDASKGTTLARYSVLCLNGCEEMRDRRCNGSDFGFDFVAPLLGESVFKTLLIQPLATAF